MTRKELIFTNNAPRPIGPYSQAVRVGDLLFLAGQVPIDPATGQVVKGDIKTQTKRVLENIKGILDTAGLSFDDVIKVTVYLARREDYPGMNEVYREYFQRDPPARTTIVAHMVSDDFLVEIDVIASYQKR
ncbi:MAG: Rid family detoxifying hydrolase [Aigarchaeota archaeon]|nr:Rid family detoxifying hydrolase [Aigarchaeota archaeon]MDW8092751.1 Rid family detoxifying hydrolase [Nitrososphaerota archaeon]